MSDKLLPIYVVARRLKVSAVWLAGEVQAGRVPALEAGDRYLLNIDAVEKTLLERASKKEDDHV